MKRHDRVQLHIANIAKHKLKVTAISTKKKRDMMAPQSFKGSHSRGDISMFGMAFIGTAGFVWEVGKGRFVSCISRYFVATQSAHWHDEFVFPGSTWGL